MTQMIHTLRHINSIEIFLQNKLERFPSITERKNMRTVTLHVPLNRKSIRHNLECLDSVLCCFALKKKKEKEKERRNEEELGRQRVSHPQLGRRASRGSVYKRNF